MPSKPSWPSGTRSVIPPPKPGHEIRLNDNGTLDEVVGWGFFHLEQMSAGHWWLSIDTEDGRMIHVNFYTNNGKTILAFVEDQGKSDLWLKKLADEGFVFSRRYPQGLQ